MISVLFVLVAASASGLAGATAPEPPLGLQAIAPRAASPSYCANPVPGPTAGSYT